MEILCIMVHWDTRIHTVVEMLSKVRADYIGLLVLILPDGYAMLMRPNKAETAVPSMAATARVIWLCACVRYWPDRGLVFSVSLAFIVVCTHEGCSDVA